MQKEYEAPTISMLGTVQELTLQGGADKCNGTGDNVAYPEILSQRFAPRTRRAASTPEAKIVVVREAGAECPGFVVLGPVASQVRARFFAFS